MTLLKKYPSIEQFRTVVKKVTEKSSFAGIDADGSPIFDVTKPLPTLHFTGTVKLHGTNAGVGFNLGTGESWCQSRGRVLTSVQDDNAGFYAFWQEVASGVYWLDHLRDYASYQALTYTSAVVYGEWCGSGIQKGVAINQLPRMFVVFGIKLFDADGEGIWLPDSMVKYITNGLSLRRVFTIMDFGVWNLEVDFNRPELAQNKLIELTEAVEKRCPVGACFGVEGTGEGIVWKSVTEPYTGSDFMFKVKGEKHSASKVHTLAPVDVEKVNSIAELVDKIVTENRLTQGLDYLRESGLEADVKSTGAFIKWVVSDCLKEESDTMYASGLSNKEVCPALVKAAKTWYFKNL